jgi:hypothetical protein
MVARKVKRFLVVDGPEKAGKSTLIKAIAELWNGPVDITRWGPVYPDDRVYTDKFKAQFAEKSNDTLYIWDRSWASEQVYGKLLERQRRLANDPWLGEWLHGRVVNGRGIKLIVIPTDPIANAKLRDVTDLPVDPRLETKLFSDYYYKYGWDMFHNDYSRRSLEFQAESTVKMLGKLREQYCEVPRFQTWPSVGHTYNLVLGDSRNPNDSKTLPGAWLPFTSLKMTQFVRQWFGKYATQFAWSNAADVESGEVDQNFVLNARSVIAFGDRAQELCKKLGVEKVHSFAHPAYFSRWNTDRGRTALEKFTTTFPAVLKEMGYGS